jgi:hypothetical protein
MVVHVVQWLMNDMISPELGYVGFPPWICRLGVMKELGTHIFHT